MNAIWKTILTATLAFVSCNNGSSITVPTIPVTQNGITLLSINNDDDWTLPTSATPKANTGFYDSPPELQNEDIRTGILTWKEMNPQEGVYDFSKLEQGLAQAKILNLRVWLRIYSSDVIHVPQWVLEKYPNAPRMKMYTGEGPTYPDLLGNDSPAVFIAPWDAGINQEFLKFMAAFAQKDFLASQNIAFMYAPGAWRWTEWKTAFVQQMKDQGLTPETYFTWFKQYLDAYVKAAKQNVFKLVFTGYGTVDRSEDDSEWVLALNDLETGLNRMTDYAVQAGMSVRVGDLEYFNQFDIMPAWGAPFMTEDGFNYQVIDNNNPLRSDSRRIVATENEAFGDPKMLTNTSDPYYIKMVTLKSLQLGMNWLNTQDFGYKLNPEVLQYARKLLGKTAAESPDAWVALRSFKDTLYGSSSEVIPGFPKIEAFIKRAKSEFRNWERFLIQREVIPGGQTIATNPNLRTASTDVKNGASFDAIRTDKATGNGFIYFKINQTFAATYQSVQIKVTYLDNGATWNLEYKPDATELTSPSVIGGRSGLWKTATFNFSKMPISSGYPKAMDFRLHSTSIEDLSVSFVRIVKP